MRINPNKRTHALHISLCTAAVLLAFNCQAQNGTTDLPAASDLPLALSGDLGLGVHKQNAVFLGSKSGASVLPFLRLNYGPAFMRLDTVGIKTARLGYGYLEVVGRYGLGGLKADALLPGIQTRSNPLFLGVGTLQITPIGGFSVNAFYDLGKSKGLMAEAIYGLRFGPQAFRVYPQLGVEYASAKYTQYHYGVDNAQALASAGSFAAYQPGSSVQPLVGALIDIPLSGQWHINALVRHKWLTSTIRNSPLVANNSSTSAVVAAVYRFK